MFTVLFPVQRHLRAAGPAPAGWARPRIVLYLHGTPCRAFCSPRLSPLIRRTPLEQGDPCPMDSPIIPGAAFLPPSSCRFLLWAPRARRAAVRLVGPAHRDVPHARPAAWILRGRDRRRRGRPAVLLPPGGGARSARPAPRAINPTASTGRPRCWIPRSTGATTAGPASTCATWSSTSCTSAPSRRKGPSTPPSPSSRLRELGVTAVEIMPVAQFPGGRNWGYDGVYPFAVQPSYGGAARAEAARRRRPPARPGRDSRRGLQPSRPGGELLPAFRPLLHRPLPNALGRGAQLRRPRQRRRARFLPRQRRHVAGGIPPRRPAAGRGPLHPRPQPGTSCAEIADAAEAAARRLGRPFHLIAESDQNDPAAHPPAERGRPRAVSAVERRLPSRAARLPDRRAQRLLRRSRRPGAPGAGLPRRLRSDRAILALSRPAHGAPARGSAGRAVRRLRPESRPGRQPPSRRPARRLVDFETLKLAAGLLLTSPYVPMLFMGEEYGESAPFPFFISHGDGRLIDNVRRGRKHEFASFGWHGEPFDPQDESTFRRARLQIEQAQHGRGKTLHDWHRELLRLRRSMPALARPDRQAMEVILREANALLCVRAALQGAAGDARVPLRECSRRGRVPFEPGRWRRCWIRRIRRGRARAGAAGRVLAAREVELTLPPCAGWRSTGADEGGPAIRPRPQARDHSCRMSPDQRR